MANFRDITFFISDLSDVSEVLPFIAWLVAGSKKAPYTTLGIFFLLSFLIKLYTLVTAIFHIHNMPAFHLLAFLEISAVYTFYCQLVYRRVFIWGLVVIAIMNAANTLFVQDINSFNSLAWTVDTMMIIIIGIAYFFVLYNNENDYTPLTKRPDFIITAGWLIYAAGSFFAYLMGTKILTGYAGGFFKNAWFFQTLSNISKNLLVSYGFWLTKKK